MIIFYWVCSLGVWMGLKQKEAGDREEGEREERQTETETEGDRAVSLHSNTGAGSFLGGILQVQSLNKKAKQDAPFSKYYHF